MDEVTATCGWSCGLMRLRTTTSTKIKAKDGWSYLLDHLEKTRGKTKVDSLGDAFHELFKKEASSKNGEEINDCEMRLRALVRRSRTSLAQRDAEVKKRKTRSTYIPETSGEDCGVDESTNQQEYDNFAGHTGGNKDELEEIATWNREAWQALEEGPEDEEILANFKGGSSSLRQSSRNGVSIPCPIQMPPRLATRVRGKAPSLTVFQTPTTSLWSQEKQKGLATGSLCRLRDQLPPSESNDVTIMRPSS